MCSARNRKARRQEHSANLPPELEPFVAIQLAIENPAPGAKARQRARKRRRNRKPKETKAGETKPRNSEGNRVQVKDAKPKQSQRKPSREKPAKQSPQKPNRQKPNPTDAEVQHNKTGHSSARDRRKTPTDSKAAPAKPTSDKNILIAGIRGESNSRNTRHSTLELRR